MVESTAEHILTHSYKADLISYMKSHPEDFEEVIKLATSDKQPYSWRAAWLLWSCMEKNDQRVHRYVEKIIETLPTKCDDQARELLIVLQRMEFSDDCEGKLFDICINIWEETGKQPSVRYNAFKLMVRITKNHPDLSNEIKFLTESHYTDSLSDTVKKSISGMVAELNQQLLNPKTFNGLQKYRQNLTLRK